MPACKGNVFETRGNWNARVSIGPKQRAAVALPQCTTREDAERRAAIIADAVAGLRRAGHDDHIRTALKQLGSAKSDEELARVVRVIGRICDGRVQPAPRVMLAGITFGEFARKLTSRELQREFPDHVDAIGEETMADYTAKLRKYVLPHVKDIPLSAFTIEHALDVMRHVPEHLSPPTRRHIAQIMRRVLGLAVFPARVIASNPIPDGFLPKLP